MPDSEDTTAYELALALKNEFSENELAFVSNMLRNISPGGGAEIYLEGLLALVEPLPSEFQSAARTLGELTGGTSSIGGFLPGFIDALIEVNASRSLSAEAAAAYIMQAVNLIPGGEGTTFYDIYSALSAAFSPAELPVVLAALLGRYELFGAEPCRPAGSVHAGPG